MIEERLHNNRVLDDTEQWFVEIENALDKFYVSKKRQRRDRVVVVVADSPNLQQQRNSQDTPLKEWVPLKLISFPENQAKEVQAPMLVNTDEREESEELKSDRQLVNDEDVVHHRDDVDVGPVVANQEIDEEQFLDTESEFDIEEGLTCNYLYSQHGIKKEITVGTYDLKKLSPNQYLNDSLINFFLKVLEIDIVNDEMKQRVMIMNTYFFSKLAPNEQIELISHKDTDKLTAMFAKNYPTVRRWAKEDIFAKDFLVFPINLPEHWSMIIVCNPNPRLAAQEGDQINDQSHGRMQQQKRPWLLYFDSFGLLDQKHASVIRMYLQKEYEARYGISVQFDEKVMRSFQPLVPRQTNFVDCGLYLLEYVENFLENPSPILESCAEDEEWNGLRWFPRCNVRHKRRFILELVLDLIKLDRVSALENYKKKRFGLRARKLRDEREYDHLKINEFNEHMNSIHRMQQDLSLKQFSRNESIFVAKQGVLNAAAAGDPPEIAGMNSNVHCLSPRRTAVGELHELEIEGEDGREGRRERDEQEDDDGDDSSYLPEVNMDSEEFFNSLPKMKLSPRTRHRCLLDFYMNPNYNEYTLTKP